MDIVFRQGIHGGGLGVRQRHLAQGARDEENHQPAHRISDQQCGTGAADAGGRSQKEAGTDRAADGDELQMPRGQAAAQGSDRIGNPRAGDRLGRLTHSFKCHAVPLRIARTGY